MTAEDAIPQALEVSAKAAGVKLKPSQLRDQSPTVVANRILRIEEIMRDIAAMPVLDGRALREIMDDLNAL